MMMTGKVAHPETGQTMRDLEAAKLFIDTLEMLEAKTRGNLSQPGCVCPPARSQSLVRDASEHCRRHIFHPEHLSDSPA